MTTTAPGGVDGGGRQSHRHTKEREQKNRNETGAGVACHERLAGCKG